MASTLEDRLAAAKAFLVQSPPGEINDVFTDLRAIVADDHALEQAILPALKQYNLEQFTVVELDRRDGRKPAKVIVTPASEIPQPGSTRDCHVSWSQDTSFEFDHMTATASNLAPIPESELYDDETRSTLRAIDSVLVKHVENHYHDGVCAVYPLPDERYPAPAPADESQPERDAAGPVETSALPVTDTPGKPAEDSLAQDLPETASESAQVAMDTADAAADALEEGVEQGSETVPAEGAQAMDVGTPAEPEQAPEVAETDEHEEAAEPAPEAQKRPPKTSRLFGLYLVGNKYNPSNYWTGRWRSKYVVDHETGTLEGTAMINIHYYEQGNVQLSTTLTSKSQLSPSPTPEQIVAAIKASEQSFSSSLSSTYSVLSDDTFKGLRRALPKTRSKIDWNKASGYRLGAELGGAGVSQ
ncbi:Cap1p [Sporobolomyces koalae]|uniref:Cap1p n=1 Tax=Sporobolomyces koalae TaxID=500713 RepID=UPI003174785E